jgi:hypothetical protein
LLLAAMLSALVVAGVYEVGGRARRRSAADTSASRLEQAVADTEPERSEGRQDESCTALRRRYLARCPEDLPAAVPSEQRAAPGAAPSPESTGRAVAELAAWLNPSPNELAELATHCEVRFVIPAITENQPPRLSDEDAAALSLSNRERGLIDRTLGDMHKEFREFAARAYAEAAGPSAQGSAPTLEAMLADLQTRPENGFEAAREKLARERAGMAPPPRPGTRLPPGERLLRRWATLGDELERQLSDGVGSERAHQLRFSPRAVWTRRFAESGCRSPP